MTWLDNLKAKVGNVEVSVAGAKAARGRMPRDTVLAAIDHSIAYQKDAKYVLPNGKGKGKPPVLIYKISGNDAILHVPFGRKRLKLGRVGDQIKFDASKLSDALEQLRVDVAAGAFDIQLSKLKSSKSTTAKTKQTKAAAAKSSTTKARSLKNEQ
jgi:hypothetical protein